MKENVLNAKKEIVSEIVENINKSEAIILVEYRGLTVEQLTDLRKKYREKNVGYKVYKNTMMNLAFKETGHEDFTEHLKGPNAVAFGFDDPVEVAKITHNFAKENDKLVIKAAILDGKIIEIEKIKQLAELPSREVLIAQVLGGLNAPISGFASVLNQTLSKIVYTLNAVKEKRSWRRSLIKNF